MSDIFDFDPVKEYPESTMTETMPDALYRTELSVIRRLYKTMTEKKGGAEEIERVIKYIYILHYAHMHIIDWKKAKSDLRIDDLKRKYLYYKPEPVKISKITRNELTQKFIPYIRLYLSELEAKHGKYLIDLWRRINDPVEDIDDVSISMAIEQYYYNRPIEYDSDDREKECRELVRYLSDVIVLAICAKGFDELVEELFAGEELSVDRYVDDILEKDGCWYNV